ncbi:right-handed parallel beta-helix repeat-containing protein [Pseudonocardia spinosispora]|uniref:right-handed parallel beta-helix repeat-containing protein n=1 Tax=Pseudonocardia spinosispora TaxID=103441 RepID=UPI0004093597|nr:right-handed parallel beta-helix repeat-containing protein [Pseudonocardia spinosispora]
MKAGLAAIATGALLVAGTALVGSLRHDPIGPFGDSTQAAGLEGEQPQAAPILPPVPDPAAEAAAKEEQEKDEAAAKAKKEAAAKKKAAAADDGGTVSLVNCTKQVTSGAALTQAISAAKAGDKICATGNMGASRLTVSKGGTATNPVQIVGNGTTAIKGITIDASNVVVSGFTSIGPKAPGIELTGNNITVSNNTVKHPTGGDYDGLRFFGNNLKILNNTITDISPDGSGAHADCMQTFASDTPASQNVLISGNKCQRIDNQCLIAEGPNDGEGDGKGTTSNITFANNVCEANASQALMIEDVKNMVVRNNTISGKVDKAFAFDIGSTGAKVLGNKLASGIGYEVGMDATSKSGYQGPAVGGGP